MAIAKSLKVLLVVLTVILTEMGTGSALAEEIRPLQSILSDVERQMGELTINLDDIKKRIDFLHNLPVTNDPVIQELRALDLQGWNCTWNNGNCNLNICDLRRPCYDKFRDFPVNRMS